MEMCPSCEKNRELERILERVNGMLRDLRSLIQGQEATRLVEEMQKQTTLYYHDYEVPHQASPEQALESCISAAIKCADHKSRMDGEPAVVFRTPSGNVIITRRSRFQKEWPFGSGPESLIYDTETGKASKG